MIQRIQTLYLLGASVLMALTFFLPLGLFTTEAGEAVFRTYELVGADGVVEKVPSYLMFLTLVALWLPVYIIFLYKKRLAQIRFCVVEMVLLVGVVLMEAFYCYRLYSLFDETYEVLACSFRWPLLCPLAALLLTWLASRAIFKDELLVRAADRIR